jgi:hypothetical protein
MTLRRVRLGISKAYTQCIRGSGAYEPHAVRSFGIGLAGTSAGTGASRHSYIQFHLGLLVGWEAVGPGPKAGACGSPDARVPRTVRD